jgi:dTDP-4-amino-4,6-dideoxygalactose transaminase
LKIYPLEVVPETLDLDYQQLEALSSQRLLCIITANLFGVLNDVPRALQIAHAKGAFVVDDAAQALGTMRNRQLAGTTGDVGIYSLGRGKPLPAGEGGVIVTDSERIASVLRQELRFLPSPSWMDELELLSKVVCGSLFLAPRLFWIPNSIKFLRLGVTEFDPSFPVSRLSRVSDTLLSQRMGSLEDLNEVRSRNAERLTLALRDNPYFRIPEAPQGYRPTYLRFPLLAKDRPTRDRAVQELRGAGIGATPFYPSAICDIGGVTRHMAVDDFHRPKAEELSRRLLTLPTHPLVRERDLNCIAEVLRSIYRSACARSRLQHEAVSLGSRKNSVTSL